MIKKIVIKKMTPNELEQNLAQFTRITTWYQYSVLFPKVLLTDGAKFLADEAGAYWLMDIIASYQSQLIAKKQYYQIWTLIKDPKEGMPNAAVITCDAYDYGNYIELLRQEIEYTDFPLNNFELYSLFDGEYIVIFLPSEYW